MPPGLVRRGVPLWVYIALGVLSLLAIAVVVLLPDMTPEVRLEKSATVPAARAAQGIDPRATEQALARRKAEAALHEVLKLQAQLDEEGVRRWAQKDYTGALEELAAADVAMQAGRFSQALQGYQGLVGKLTDLLHSQPRRLVAALLAGAKALQVLDASEAAKQYAIALAIDPKNIRARQGARRASHLNEVVALVDSAKYHEQQSEWMAAHDAYAKAVRLDAEFTPARAGLKRVNARLEKIRWHELLSTFYQAMDRNDLQAASATLKKIRAQRPRSPELKQAVARLVSTAQESALKKLRAKSEHLLAAEDFAGALATYDKALQVDPKAAFAQAGHDESERRLRLSSAMHDLLLKPRQVFAEKPLENARKLLAAVQALDGVGPKLAAQRDRLQDLIRVAETPTRVTLLSDGLTRVNVYRVGDMGHFAKRQLKLRPGAYTVVGSRDGYRDVRVTLQVKPGPNPDPVRVVCKERV